MISVPITDVKNFMAHLLSRETFDLFYLVEASFKKKYLTTSTVILMMHSSTPTTNGRIGNTVSGKRCALLLFR